MWCMSVNLFRTPMLNIIFAHITLQLFLYHWNETDVGTCWLL